MIKNILISEPWDFESEAGKNVLEVNIISNIQGKLVAVTLSKYEGMAEKLLIENRDMAGNINIYHLPGGDITQKQFAMIGKIL